MCHNPVISRGFYRLCEIAGEFCGSYAETLIGSYLCHAFYA
jgi:hypothetical protein